jgi:hypothetical protein
MERGKREEVGVGMGIIKILIISDIFTIKIILM